MTTPFVGAAYDINYPDEDWIDKTAVDHDHRGRDVGAGAGIVEEPLDTPYGDRRAMVRDPFGNVFQIAHTV